MAVGELCASWAASTQWHFFAAKPVGILSYSAAVALSSRISIAAEAAGMAQGELRGAIQNLQQFCNILGPLCWGRGFAFLSERGRGRDLYVVAAAMTVAQLALSPLAGLSGKEQQQQKEQR